MLHIRSWFVFIAATALVAALPVSSARADERDELTYFTFSAPVEIPGTALPAGTYMFKLADPDGDRNVIRVLNKDGSKVFATFFGVPNERLTSSDEPIVTFEEAPAGAPEAIKAWFYPGDKTGREFVYPKDQGQRIAAATHQQVLTSASVRENQKPASTSTAASVQPLKNAAASRVDDRGNTQPMNSDTSSHTAPMKSLSKHSAAPSASATAEPKRSANRSTELPRTASSLPLIGLLGLASLAVGLGTMALRKRVL
ncbi:MAG TPA: hypothetical protein VH497_07530 [Vicinamibacterales bacterium]|jgi:hypothetical protein